jgi:hypothetical protein
LYALSRVVNSALFLIVFGQKTKASWGNFSHNFEQFLGALIAGAVGGLLLYGLVHWFGTWKLASGEENYVLSYRTAFGWSVKAAGQFTVVLGRNV